MVKHVVLVTALSTTLFVALSLLWGCGHESAATQQVMSAAAVDLSCDKSALEFVEDAPMQKRVSGCGRTLTYMYKCNAASGGGQDCRWKAVPTEDDR